MKKTFKKLLALFLTGTMLAGVGCKDYDDDIDKINDRIDELTTGKIADIESQLNSMKTTVESLKALESRVQALEDTQITDEDLQPLRDAIDAIEANYVTKDYLTTTLNSYATTQYVGKAIKDVTDALGKFKTESAIQEAIDAAKNAAITAAGEACKAAFQTRFDAAVAAAGLVTGNDITTAIDEYDVTIKAYLTQAIEDNNGVIDDKIATEIQEAVDGLSAKIAGRLTSVQLIPELYIDGIETIELGTFSYFPLTITTGTDHEGIKAGDAEQTTSIVANSIRYLISPSAVTKEDIQAPEFLFEQAATRAAVSTKLLEVTDYSVANGVLTVAVKKIAGAELKPEESNAIYTAALKVPIAKKWLGEGEDGAAVYSDYARLSEAKVTPQIAALYDKNSGKRTEDTFECTDKKHYHFSENTVVVKNSNTKPSLYAAYDSDVDLNAMVTGCYEKDGVAKEITKEALKAAGLEFRFTIPAINYVLGDNKTNQQEFAEISEDGIMTSKLPDGTKKNAAAIDKMPIVRVTLVDVNNNDAIVDARYFKIQWVKEVIEPTDLGTLKNFEYELSCATFKGEFTWKEMVNEVLGKLNGGKGLSQDEFLKTYTKVEISTSDIRQCGEVGTSLSNDEELVYTFDDAVNESAAAFTWVMTPGRIGNVINDLLADKEVTRNVTVTIKAEDNLYAGDITFNFVLKVLKPSKLPSIYGYDEKWWHTNYTVARVLPMTHDTEGALDYCTYNYELDRIFNESKPVKDLLPCGKWDIQFTHDQNIPYSPAQFNEPAGMGNGMGYFLYSNGGQLAVKMNYNGMGDNWYKAATSHEGATNVAGPADITMTVEHNDAGKAILGKQATVKVWASINDLNFYEVASFDLLFVEPLTATLKTVGGSFTDRVEGGSKLSIGAEAFTVTDFNGKNVTVGSTLGNYYKLTKTVWDLDNAKTNITTDAEGNRVIDNSLTGETAKTLVKDEFGEGSLTSNDDNTELTFMHVNGVPLEKAAKIFIPVSCTHYWGTFTGYAVITVNPGK